MKIHKKQIIIASTVIVMTFVMLLGSTYVFHFNSPIVNAVRKFLHLPAMVINGKWISINEIEKNTQSIQSFYENQDFAKLGIRIDFSTRDGMKRLKLQERRMLNKLVEDYMIEKLAKEWDIVITNEAVQAAIERPMKEMNTQDGMEEKLQKLYGWSLRDFADKVVYGQLLRDKVAAKFERDNIVTEQMRVKVNQAKKELDDGRIFSDVAIKYSEGSTARDGGKMGWFKSEQLQDEVGKTIKDMEKGSYSDMIETPLGLHIVYVDNVIEKDGVVLTYVSQIIIKKQTFADFLAQEIIDHVHVREFLPEYKWNQEKGIIEFANQDMIDFENKTHEDAQNLQEKLTSEN